MTASISPSVRTERGCRQAGTVVKVCLVRIVCPGIPYSHRMIHILTPDNHFPSLDHCVRPVKYPVRTGNDELMKSGPVISPLFCNQPPSLVCKREYCAVSFYLHGLKLRA